MPGAASRRAGFRRICRTCLVVLPRLAGVTCARCALFGAKTRWKRVRLRWPDEPA
jgi:hypothetical protein